MGNNSYGYFVGSEVYPTFVDRVDYSSDTPTMSPKGPLAFGHMAGEAAGNNDYGWYGSGFEPGGGGYHSKVNRLDYSNDSSVGVQKGDLAASSYMSGATGNLSYGYWAGGITPAMISTISRIDYSNDTATASTKGPLAAQRARMGSTGNSSYGYYGGGNPSSPGMLSSVERLDYSNDSATAVVKGPLSADRDISSATGSASYGYWSNGYNAYPALLSTVDRIDYSNDTATASPKGPLASSVYGAGSVSGQENGLLNSPTAAVAAPVQPPFPFPVQLPVAPAGGPAYGYWSGGYNSAPPSNPATTEIGRIDFSNDTATTVLKGNMHTGRSNHSSIGNQTHAYSGGGGSPASSPSYVSSIERMTYANDTATSVDKSTFRAAFTQAPSPGQGANAAVAIGNQSYGYWQAGNATYVDRLDYSNDTAQAAAKSNSTITSNSRAAVGNLSYGYFVGGWVNKSVVDRLDYADDTTTMSTKGNLASAVSHNFGVGNSNYGYVVAGRNTGESPYRSLVQRIDFGNDTATATPKGPLAGTSYKGGGTGDASYGYVVAGDVGPAYSTTIFRIDYASDTATAPAKSTFSYAGRSMRGFSPRAYGLPN